MSVVITNVTKGGVLADAKGMAEYTVRINEGPVIARFYHKRTDGLARCLSRASDAVTYADLDRFVEASTHPKEAG